MTIDTIRKEATRAANEFEFDWDKLSDMSYRTDFLAVLNSAREINTLLESIYTKLASNESIALAGQESPLEFDERERYIDAVSDALFENLTLCEIFNKYEMIESVISTAYPLDNPPQTE